MKDSKILQSYMESHQDMKEKSKSEQFCPHSVQTEPFRPLIMFIVPFSSWGKKHLSICIKVAAV